MPALKEFRIWWMIEIGTQAIIIQVIENTLKRSDIDLSCHEKFHVASIFKCITEVWVEMC